MKGYKLRKPQTLPRIVWACKTKVDHYDWKNTNKPNMIEFSVCSSGKRTVIASDGQRQTVEGKIFSCLMGDEKRKSYAEDGVSVEILSVAVALEDLSFSSAEITEEDLSEPGLLLLPASSLSLSESLLMQTETLLYRIIEAYKEHSAPADLQCAATVLNLMADLDKAVRRSLKSKKDKYVHYYVDKADAIVCKRYAEKLSVQGVAKELSVTPNYLSAIFRAAKGQRFCDRLLEVRMEQAAKLFKEGSLSLADVASAVGYDDLGHFRRRFRQYFGIGLRDYCLIEKELTLYHRKPQRQSEDS